MRSCITVFILVLSGAAMVVFAQPRPIPPPRPPVAPPAQRNPQARPPAPASTERPAPTRPGESSTTAHADEQAIRQVIAAFTKAYNAADAGKVAALFTPDAEVIDDEGNVSHGRATIEQIFAGVFAEHPQGKMEITVESLRFLGPTVAMEEGVATVKHEPAEPAEPNRYSVVHVKQDGRWLMARAHDLSDNETSATTELKQLEWMIGNWVDESSDGLVKADYRWTENHRFIVGDFAIHVQGRQSMSGSHRIGWDPLAQQIRSWVFDSEGGFAEGLWTRQGKRWIVKLSGVSRHGRIGSATNIYSHLGADKYSFESHDRTLGGETLPDTATVVVVREPPEPGE